MSNFARIQIIDEEASAEYFARMVIEKFKLSVEETLVDLADRMLVECLRKHEEGSIEYESAVMFLAEVWKYAERFNRDLRPGEQKISWKEVAGCLLEKMVL